MAIAVAKPDLYDTGLYIEEVKANIVNLDLIRG